jgi:hypothetical protein
MSLVKKVETPLEDVIDAGGRYRYLPSYSFVDGSSKYNRLNASIGGLMLQETNSLTPPDQYETDYIEQINSSPVTIENGIELKCNFNINHKHLTHVTLWRTENLEDPGVDLGFARETYIWLADIPVSILLKVSSINSDPKYANAIIEFETNTYPDNLIGLTFTKNDKDYTIQRIVTYEQGVLEAVVIASEQTDFDLLSENDYLALKNFSNNVYNCEGFSQIDDFFTIRGDSAWPEDVFESLLHFEDGSIFRPVSGDSFEIDGYFITRNVSPDDFQRTAVLVNYKNQKLDFTYIDNLDDEALIARRDSGDALFFLQTRIHVAIPEHKYSAIQNAVYLAAIEDDSEYFYFQLGVLYRSGYYHPGFQKSLITHGKITRLMEFPNNIAIFGDHFTLTLDTSAIKDVGEADIGESIIQLFTPKLVTNKIGIVKSVRPAKYMNGSVWVMTNEPAVRLFDGYQYSDDVTENSIHDTEIVRLRRKVIMKWIPWKGLFIWGERDSSISPVSAPSFPDSFLIDDENNNLIDDDNNNLFVGIE